MYVSSQSEPKIHLGKFKMIDTKNFKRVDENICKAANVTGIYTMIILGDPDSRFTHSNPTDKQISSATFEWMSDNSRLLSDSGNDIVIRSVITHSPPPAYGGKPNTPRWMELPPLSLSKAMKKKYFN